MRWHEGMGIWSLSSLGRNLEEIDAHVARMEDNGITGIKIYSMQRFPDKQGPQGTEGGLEPIMGGSPG